MEAGSTRYIDDSLVMLQQSMNYQRIFNVYWFLIGSQVFRARSRSLQRLVSVSNFQDNLLHAS